MALENQVMILYAAINGYIDDIPVDKVVDLETNFYNFMKNTHPGIGSAIVKDKDLSDGTEEKLKAAIDEFKQSYRIETVETVSTVESGE